MTANRENTTESLSTENICWELFGKGHNAIRISESLAEALETLDVEVLGGDFDGLDVSEDDYWRIRTHMLIRLAERRAEDRRKARR